MMNAIEVALDLLEGAEPGLALAHTRVALEHGGFAVWEPDVVCIAVPWDAVGGDEGRTMTVLYCGGDAGRLAEYGERWARMGYEWVVWCRGFKRGYHGLQKRALGRWAKLVKCLNGYGAADE